MSDRSTPSGVRGGKEGGQPAGLEVQEGAAPPHSPTPELQLHRSDLRHRLEVEARGSPTPSRDLTGATSSPGQERHHPSTNPEQKRQQQKEGGQAVAQSTSRAAQPQPKQPWEPQPSTTPAPPVPSFLPPSSTAGSQIATSTSASTSTSTPTSSAFHVRIAEHDYVRSLASGEPSPISSGSATPSTDPTAHRHRPKSLRPFIHAIMAFEKGRKFSTGTSVHRKRQMSTLVEKEGAFGPALTVCSFL